MLGVENANSLVGQRTPASCLPKERPKRRHPESRPKQGPLALKLPLWAVVAKAACLSPVFEILL